MPDYKELYKYDAKHSLVIDEISGEVFISKHLTHYDMDVYEYIRSHRDRHIPRIRDLIDNGSVLTVIEEYIKGNTFDVILDDTSVPDKTKTNYFLELCDGLKFLHSAPKPIIHRDLKPSNIIIADDGRLVIIDYDAAKTYKDDQAQDTTFLGTEGRAAPEQYGFMQSDARTDIYAVGRMLKDAFPGNDRFRKVADKAMSFDPKDRYENIDAFRNALTHRISSKMIVKPLFPPPGFRTGTWWKIALAIMIYPFIAYTSFALSFESGDLMDTYFTRVFFIVFWLTVIDIWTSWTGMFDNLPFIGNKHFIVRLIAKIVYSVIALIVLMFPYLLLLGLARHITALF